MKLYKAIRLFLGEYRDTTAASYKPVLMDMQKYLAASPLFEDIKPEDIRLDAITAPHLIEYRQAIGKRDYTAGTRGKYIKTMKVFWNWCVRLELIQKTPASALKNERQQQAVDRSKAMTEEELKTLLSFSRWHPRLDALVRFLADTGCRRGGAAGLRIRDLDLIQRTAQVTEKGEKSRYVAFGKRTAQALQRWIDKRPGDQGEYVFSRYGEPPTPYAVSQLFRRGCIEAGIRSLGTHSLRYRKGYQFSDAGISPSIAAAAMGHSDVMITLRHYYPHDWASARLALENLSLPDTPDIDDLEI